jgi:hypothetical protein
LALFSVFELGRMLISIERHGLRAQRCEFNMKFRMDETLRFWVDIAYENVKSDHEHPTKGQLVAQILRIYEQRGDAMRCLDCRGKLAWKASPRFLSMLADAERDARDDLADWP